VTTYRERILGAARADLAALPELVEQLDPTERHHDITAHRGKAIGSPALVHLEVVHLLHGGEHRPWHGEDPRYGDMTERYKAALVLAGWTRILAEELPEYPDLTEQPTVRSEAAVLIEYWSWISDQQWATELSRDIAKVAARVRTVLGIKPEPEYSCPQCGNPAYLQPGGILGCTEVQDHHIVVRDLEQQQRRRPPIGTKEVHDEFGVQPGTLRQWKNRRKIQPARTEHGRNWWWPWDVFCLLNPDIAEAIRIRDEVDAG
jgi:hypothetical protein